VVERDIAGCGNGYTLTPILLAVEMDTHCTPIQLVLVVVKGIPMPTACPKLQVVESDTPCISIVYRRLLMVLFLLMVLKNNK
jgi:hypothetical protein